jgi:glutamate 5-kinase
MQRELKQRILPATRRLVIKLGSSVVTTASGVNRERVGQLVAEMARLVRDGYQIVIVTSGARAGGLARLGLSRIPTSIPEQQAAAAIGQIRLMLIYDQYFADLGYHVGQVLLTAADLEHRARYLNAKHTIDHLLAHGIIPIVNENDSVAVEELKFGDNDRLSALVAGLTAAQLLIVLTDVDGVYASDPRAGDAELLEVVDDVDAALLGSGGTSGALGTGGMASKLEAARSAAHRGIPTMIANGTEPGILAALMDPERSVGSIVVPRVSPISSRKHWIAYGVARHGTLVVDDGARRALCERGGSLLPSGIVEVRGRFGAGECVVCATEHGREFARGLVAYDSADCERIRGKASSAIMGELGYHMGDEVIHRDDLVLLEDLDRGLSRSAEAHVPEQEKK